MNPTTETLQGILGSEFWSAIFPTAAAATNHACRRMDEGRQAVSYTTIEGAHIAAWSIKP